MKKFMSFVLPALVLMASVQTAYAQKRFSANEDSPTAVRRTGITLESVKARGNYTRYYEFHGGELAKNMKFYMKGRVYTDSGLFLVEPGVVGWLNAEGTKVVFVGCINEADLLAPIPPPQTTPSTTPTPLCVRDKWEEKGRVDNKNGTMTISYWNGCEIVQVTVSLPSTPVAQEKVCPTCPFVGPPTKTDFGTTFMGRLAQAGKQLISVEGLAGIVTGAGVTWARDGNILRAVLISAGESAALKAVFANANRFEATFPTKDGSFELKLKKGESKPIKVGGVDGTASWTNSDLGIVVTFPSVPGCWFTLGPKETRVVATYSEGVENVEVDAQGKPVKTYDLDGPGPGAGSGDYKFGGGKKGFAPSGGGAGKAAKASPYDE